MSDEFMESPPAKIISSILDILKPFFIFKTPPIKFLASFIVLVSLINFCISSFEISKTPAFTFERLHGFNCFGVLRGENYYANFSVYNVKNRKLGFSRQSFRQKPKSVS